MGKHERVDDVRLRSLSGASLDHDDGVLRARDDHVDVALRLLLEGRIRQKLAVDPRHTDRCNRSAPGDVRNVECGRSRRHRKDVGGILLVARKDGGDDLRVISVPIGKKWPVRSIHQARGEDFFVALAPFTLEEAAGDFARGECLLDVVASQREKVDSRTLIAADCGNEDDALAVRDEHCAVRLFGKTTGLENDLFAVYGDGLADK